MGGFFQFIVSSVKMIHINTDLRFKVILMFDNTVMEDVHKERENCEEASSD